MALKRKLKTFLGKSGAERRMICEAILMLAGARIIVLTVPFRFQAKWLERAPDGQGAADTALVARVRRAVTTAARNVPWNAVCLPQALAAKAMLARRGQGSAFHLGATFDQNGKLIAHAWLECRGEIVTGAAGIRGMSHLVRFG
ncbi:MAG: lasso peptide biosynthesis B2 protein [Stellaceae bacterium]